MKRHYTYKTLLFVFLIIWNSIITLGQNISEKITAAKIEAENENFAFSAKLFKGVSNYFIDNKSIDSAGYYLSYSINSYNKIGQLGIDTIIINYLSNYKSNVHDSLILLRLNYQLGNYYSQNYFLEEAISVFHNIFSEFNFDNFTDHKLLANIYNQYGFALGYNGELDSAAFYVNKSHEIIKANYTSSDKELGASFNNLAIISAFNSDLIGADSLYEKSISILSKTLGENHIALANIYSNWADTKTNLGQYDKAELSLFKAISIFENNGLEVNTITPYLNLSRLKGIKREYKSYKLYLDKLSGLVNQYIKQPHFTKQAMYNAYSVYYSSVTNEFEKADSFLRLAIFEINQLTKPNSILRYQPYFNLAQNLLRNNKINEAKLYSDKARRILILSEDTSSIKMANLIFLNGELLNAQQKLQEANKMYKDALNIYIKIYGEKHEFVISCINTIASNYHELSQLDSTEFYLKLGMKFLNIKDLEKLKSIESYRPNRLAFFLQKLRFNYAISLDYSSFKEIVEFVIKVGSDAVYDRFFITNSEDFSNVYSQLIEIYNIGIAASIKSYEISHNDQDLVYALYFKDEKSKLNLDYKIPIKNLIKMYELDSTQIKELKNIINEAAYFELNSIGEENLIPKGNYNQRIMSLKSKINLWKSNLQKKQGSLGNPNMTDYKLQLSALQQRSCKSEFTCLIYISVNDSYYCITVGCNGLKANLLGLKDSIDTKVYDYLENISKLSKGADFQKQGVQLYSCLLSPMIKDLMPKLKIILEDGISFLNFETLIEKVSDTDEMEKWDWVIKNFEIIYYPNIPKIRKSPNLKLESNDNLVFFIPGFNKMECSIDTRSYSSTPWSLQLAKDVSGFNKSVLYTAENANIENWNSSILNADLLHVGTHIESSLDNPIETKLVFDQDGNGVYFYDIFSSKIESDLVILAGCQSGIGMTYMGAKNLSLSKAFLYAGANDVIQSLWKIDDEQSNRILLKFYENQQENNPYVSSLRESKTDYLKKCERGWCHPYFWGGLVFIQGDLNYEEQDKTKCILYLLFIIGIISIIFIKKRKI